MRKFKPNYKLLAACLLASAAMHSIPFLLRQTKQADAQSLVKPGYVQVELGAPAPTQKSDATPKVSGGASTAPSGVSAPSLIGQMNPAYPRRSRERGEEGDVELEFSVSADGHASEVKIISSSGYKLLDESAINAVTMGQFSPAKKDGVAQAAITRLRIRFRIKDS